MYREYSSDFFDFIVVDECHRGSARDDSNWREIIEYFQPAYQLGLTATPLRDDNVDIYQYLSNPLYTKEQVRILYRSALEIQQRWVNPEERSQIIDQLADGGIDFEDLKTFTNQPDADPFDLLCHIAFNAPVMTC